MLALDTITSIVLSGACEFFGILEYTCIAWRINLNQRQIKLCAAKMRTYVHVFIVATSILSFTSSIGV